MLKKVSHIILSVLLLVSTIGLAVSKHYCSGSFVSVSVFNEAESCCGDSDCCHNETEVYQLNEDFSLVSVSEVPQSVELDLVDFAILICSFNLAGSEERQVFDIADSPPPPKIQTALSQRQTYLL